jgi:hypothetical protein
MAKDKIHHAVRRALEKDGWTILNDPFYIESGGVMVEIDLEAEKFVAAQKANIKILIEIKGLSRRSLIYDFHSAIGQYIDYRGILKDENIDQELYLALPEIIYEEMKTKPFYAKRLLENNVKQIIIDIENETILTWIE